VRLSADSTFATVLIDTTVADTSIATGTLQYLTRMFWTVEPVNFTGPGPASGPQAFTTIIEAPAMPVHDRPTQGETDVAVPARLSWHAAGRAASYRLQLSTEGDFVPPFLRETVVADTFVFADSLASFTNYYWRLRSVNDGGQSAYTATGEFRTILAAPAATAPPDGSSQFADVRFAWRPSPPATLYRLQYGADSTFGSVAFDDSTIADTSLSASLEAGARYFWRVRATHPEGTSPWSAARSFVTTPDTFVVAAVAAWNLVSLPGNVPDRSTGALFPGALTPFYRYAGAYETEDTLGYGEGYWVRLAPGAQFVIAGTKRTLDTIEAQAGWNLIGSVSGAVAVAHIAASPPGLVASPFYGYDGGFRREDTLMPGKGYWVRMQQPGTLILGGEQPPASAGRLAISAERAVPPPPPGELAQDPQQEPPSPGLPDRTALLPNFPNPFNPSTEVRFHLSAPGDVRIEVFNALGERVETLVDGHRDAGRHSVSWDAAGLASGIYYARMTTRDGAGTMKMLLMR
jgi:hypothetical protein